MTCRLNFSFEIYFFKEKLKCLLPVLEKFSPLFFPTRYLDRISGKKKKGKKGIYLLLSGYTLRPCSERSSTSRTQHVSNKPKLRSFSMLMQIGTNNA